MSGAVRRVRRKSEKQKISSLATQGVQAGPDNDDIKQKDAPFHQKHSFDQSKELAERNLSILLVLFNMSFV